MPATPQGSLADLPRGWARRDPGRALYAVPEGPTWRDVSASEFDQQVRALARGLVAAGIEPGDRVALMSRTRYEWTLVDFALWTAGAVPVPVYETSAPGQAAWIMADSGVVAAVVETTEHLATVTGVREQVPTLRDVWAIEAGALDELVTAGAEVSEAQLDQRVAGQDRQALATIIYTSGTTGQPKGCELTHGNFLALAENAAVRLEEVIARPGSQTLLFLPLAHVFARFIQVVVLQAGARLGHCPDTTRLLEDLGTFRPTFVLAVPRVFEKIYNGAEQRAEAAGRGRVFRRATQVAERWSRAQATGGAGLRLRAERAVLDRLVYRRLRAAMGGRVSYVISGGAALGERLGHFFRGAGVTVLEGYGLTETTAPATVNTPELIKVGTVGRPLPGVTVRVADDGEIQVRGSSVFRGYHGHTQATEEVLDDDGWFTTGDIGELDGDGFLRITGRRKEILVTAGGKNVSPGPLEDQVRAHALVSQCVVVGDGRPYVAALVTLDAEMLPAWGEAHGLGPLTVPEAVENPVVREVVARAIERANDSVSRAESIRRFSLLGTELTEESGHLTPSMKVRRETVLRDFADEVDGIYARGGTPVTESD
nr:AMP-dependent synthetase/ligase [Ornithinicoccus halotolerans]